jgi:hypothetical protein
MRHSLLAASFGERETRVKDVRSRTPASLPRAKDEISTDADTIDRPKPN